MLCSSVMLLAATLVVPAGGQSDGTKATVMVAGTGPTDSLQPILDGVIETLTGAGLNVKLLGSDPRARTAAAEEAKAAGAGSLL